MRTAARPAATSRRIAAALFTAVRRVRARQANEESSQ